MMRKIFYPLKYLVMNCVIHSNLHRDEIQFIFYKVLNYLSKYNAISIYLNTSTE